jgi:AcrR family transcriptional regulator
MHYFGSKAELFAAASRFDITFPDLSDVAPDRIADVLLPLFVSVWGPEGPFLPLLRAAATNKAAAAAMLEVFVDRVAPALAAAVPDRAAERAALVGAQVLGLATARYILCIPALAEMDDAQLIEWLRPVLAHYLTGSALTGSTPA